MYFDTVSLFWPRPLKKTVYNSKFLNQMFSFKQNFAIKTFILVFWNGFTQRGWHSLNDNAIAQFATSTRKTMLTNQTLHFSSWERVYFISCGVELFLLSFLFNFPLSSTNSSKFWISVWFSRMDGREHPAQARLIHSFIINTTTLEIKSMHISFVFVVCG